MIGERIKRARKTVGFSLRDLGEKMGLSHAAIKKYEDNEVTPSSEILINLSKILKVKVEYFFRPEHFILASVQYRSHADFSESQKEEISAKILDLIEPRVELESLFPSPPIKEFVLKTKKVSNYEAIDTIANQIRHEWHLGLEPIPDLIDILEENGIKVFIIDNQNYPKFDGLSAHVNNMPIIVIGNHWSGERQRFTIAHELGHLVLGGFSEFSLEEEKCCNRFAGAVLLPNKTLISILGEHRNNIEARELSLIKENFGISMSAILHRLEDIGIISKSLYLQLRSEYHQNGWKNNEPGKQCPKEKSHIFEQMIFHALAEGYIGESKAAELMNLSLKSFRSLRAMENQSANSDQ